MSYTTRILPPEEWGKLASVPTELSWAWEALSPAHNTILVTEQDGAIVATMVLMQAIHAEFFWSDPNLRGRLGVLRGLYDAMFAEARRCAAPTILAASVSAQMTGILEKLGAPLPGQHFVIRTKGES
jgi:hypothetical protein